MTAPLHNARKAILADRIFDGRDWRIDAALLVHGGRVHDIVDRGSVPDDFQQRRLPEGAILTAGFVDLQVNGGGGVLLNDDPCVETMEAIARAHRAFGTTSLLPTFITDTREKTRAAIAATRQIAGRGGVIGLHLEGPFINPQRAGVHRSEHIRAADMRDLEWLLEVAGVGHSLVTLAPECVPEGFIRALTAHGVRVAAGHSEANATDMQRAIDEGLTGVTHLFNAMPPLSGRAPGIVGTALAEPRLVAGMIVDGLHVDTISVRAAFAAKGAAGIALVTDAMPSVGTPATEFDLLGERVTLRGGALRRGDGTLAGAHLDMATAVRNAARSAHIPLEDALRAASATPATFVGLQFERGRLVAGACADMVALNGELEVLGVWIEGVECPTSPGLTPFGC